MLILITQFQDRMWRKTLTNGTVCKGVDPNRNWDDHWNGIVITPGCKGLFISVC